MNISFIVTHTKFNLATKSTMLLISSLLALSATQANASIFTYQDIINPNSTSNNGTGLSGTVNQALGINNSGLVVGYYGNGISAPNRGFVATAPYGASNFTAENVPDPLSATPFQTQVAGINNSGATVGSYTDNSGNQHGFSNIAGAFQVYDAPLAQSTQLLAVNNNLIAAGFYVDVFGNTQGITVNLNTGIFNPFSLNGLSTIGVTAAAINDHNQIGGYYVDDNGNTLGFIDSNGRIISIPTPDANDISEVLGLNNNGLADGLFMDSNGVTHGFLFDTNTNIFTQIDAPAAAGLTILNGINDLGQMTGYYLTLDESNHYETLGLLVSPQTTVVPVPSALMLFGSGLAMMFGFIRRKTAIAV